MFPGLFDIQFQSTLIQLLLLNRDEIEALDELQYLGQSLPPGHELQTTLMHIDAMNRMDERRRFEQEKLLAICCD